MWPSVQGCMLCICQHVNVTLHYLKVVVHCRTSKKRGVAAQKQLPLPHVRLVRQ
jgi:hypothetical protein